MTRLLVLACLAGCVPTSYAYTPASSRPPASKPENCTFDIVTAPQEDLEEVGVLQHYNGELPKTADAFRAAIAKQVCRVGGDAVIPVIDDKGRYVKGTVIRYTRRPGA